MESYRWDSTWVSYGTVFILLGSVGIRCGRDWVCAPWRAFSLLASRTCWQWFLREKNFKSGPENNSERGSSWIAFPAWQSAGMEQGLWVPAFLRDFLFLLSQSLTLLALLLQQTNGSVNHNKKPNFCLILYLVITSPSISFAPSISCCCFTAKVHGLQHKTKTLAVGDEALTGLALALSLAISCFLVLEILHSFRVTPYPLSPWMSLFPRCLWQSQIRQGDSHLC